VETKTETKYVGRYGKPIETTETQVITTTYEPKTKMQTQSQNRTYGRNLGGNSNTSGKKVISEKTDEKISIQGGKKIREITITKIYSDGTKDVETMVSDN
jgi:NAD+--asparagine ADP-ribosyltransferase